MGNRTVVRFVTPSVARDISNSRAMIYLHWGGDAGYMASCLTEFFDEVEQQCGDDTRYNDPDYLAAKFVVYMAHEQSGSENNEARLDFLSVGVTTCSVLSAIRAGYHTFAVVTSSSKQLRPTVKIDEALFTDTGEVAMHQLTCVDEYLEAQRKNEEEEDDAKLV